MGIYVALIWLTTPLALFNILIMSHYDIFYTFFTLLRFLYFLKQKIFIASLLFGLSITFKYFLYLYFSHYYFFEKKLFMILLSTLICSFLMHLIFFLYQHSSAYIKKVLNFPAIYRIYYVFLDIGGIKISYFFFFIYSINLYNIFKK